MYVRQSCLWLLLAGMGVVSAAPLPVRWSLDVATGELGWRFRQDFAVWPGPYWRGQGRPPVAAKPEDPATWGLLRLGGQADTPPAPQCATTELTAPLAANRPLVDGLLGGDEWGGAAQAVEPLDLGEAWAIYAQHTADTLYVCVACPSALTLRQGQMAELYLAPAGAEGAPVASAARQLRVRADRDQRAALQTGTLAGGQWDLRGETRDDSQGWRGAASPRGDGGWAFAVYEFAVPLSLCCPPAAAAPEALRLLVRLQTLSHGGSVDGPRNADPEAVIWPDGRTSCASVAPAAGPRPDSWQRLLLRAGDAADGTAVPATTRPVKIDGQIGLKEWGDARVAAYSLPGDQWRRVWLMRDDRYLYVAVRLHVARGLRQQEACLVYVDPCGDGGLQPRGDDLKVRLPLGPESVVETLRCQDQQWRPSPLPNVRGASYPVSATESTYEVALPLAVLGPDLRPHLAVEVVYRLPR